ncbi:MAG: DUF1905 domain-containing protein [Flavobacteriales bacterium]|nr:DUF1905 domain-containing protein [Flavobacteriales bacterium]
MKFTSQLNKGNTNIYHWFFAVPKEVAEAFIEGTNRRVVATVNNTLQYHCAIHADGVGGYRMMLNRERCRKLGIIRGETIHVEVEKDRSEYGIPMSDELREVLDQNAEADRIFHSFTKGMQRTLIYWSDNVKSSDIKIRRTLVMTDHLVAQNGKPDYKLLNVEMKAANQVAKRS